MDLYKQFKTILQNMKTTDQEYNTLITEIRNTNYLMMTLASTFAMISFFILFIFSLFTPQKGFSPMTYLLISYSLACFIFLIINLLILQNRKQYLNFFIYLFMIFLFSYAYFIDIFKNKNQASVIFCAIIFIVPIIFIDKSKKINLFIFLVTVFFIFSSFFNKSTELFVKDLMNGIVFLVLETFFGRYFIYLRMRDFLILNTVNSNDYDELMYILNRTALEREITKHILISKNAGIIILIDFKNFKQLNDFYGMDFGDSVLKQIAEEVKIVFRNNDIIGRYAGDKICVFMPNLTNLDVAKVRAKMLLANLEEKVKIPQNAFELTANIGITSCKEYDETTKSLLKKAESALATAKTKGFNQIVVN